MRHDSVRACVRARADTSHTRAIRVQRVVCSIYTGKRVGVRTRIYRCIHIYLWTRRRPTFTR